MVKAEHRYPLRWVPWPQSCCRGCARIACSIPPFRPCRCLDGYVTIFTLDEYLALRAKVKPQPAPRSRSEFGTAWSELRRAIQE